MSDPTPDAMSETPRVDAARMFGRVEDDPTDRDLVTADFARTLERELATLRAERDELLELKTQTLDRYLTNAQKKIIAERDQLRAERDEARAGVSDLTRKLTATTAGALQAAFERDTAIQSAKEAGELAKQLETDDVTLRNFLNRMGWLHDAIKRPVGRIIWRVEQLIVDLASERADHQKTREELEADKARLDWLERLDMLSAFREQQKRLSGSNTEPYFLRQAIDVAMAAAQSTQPKTT